jgi:hypothetical protein
MLQTNPERSIVLIDGNGKEIGRLEILGPGENGYRVQGSALPAQAIVERSKIDDISFKKADYSDAPPAPAPPGPAQ